LYTIPIEVDTTDLIRLREHLVTEGALLALLQQHFEIYERRAETKKRKLFRK
jgi:hypothetical protein